MAIDGFLLTLILACLVLGLGITISIAPGLWARRALIASGEDAVRAVERRCESWGSSAWSARLSASVSGWMGGVRDGRVRCEQ